MHVLFVLFAKYTEDYSVYLCSHLARKQIRFNNLPSLYTDIAFPAFTTPVFEKYLNNSLKYIY
jgi:hypothetical protein